MAEDTNQGSAIRLGWGGQTDRWAANRQNNYLRQLNEYLASNPLTSPQLAEYLRTQPDARALTYIQSSVASGLPTPTSMEGYNELVRLGEQSRSDRSRYGSSGLGGLASGIDTMWTGGDKTSGGGWGIRELAEIAVAGNLLGGMIGGSGTAAGTTAGATTGSTAGTAAGTTAGTGITASQVGTGASVAGAGAGMLGGSGGDSGGSTGTINMPTTNPITGEAQQSGTGTFGTGTSGGAVSNAGAFDALGNWVTSPSGIGTIANLGAGYLQGQSSQNAAENQASAQLEAARIAAEQARFRPVGVTTGFGASQFGYDQNGRLISAGYQLTPEMQRQRDQLIAQSGGMLNQATGAQQSTAPMGQSAQSMFQLGQGYLNTSPQAQAAKYMADQQALLSTGRERDLASLQNRLIQQGRSGLATGGTGMMGAANPELEAFYNAQRQQDLGLAAQATQGGMDYAKFGAGMVGLGGTTLQDMYRTQSAAYDPYNTSLQGASNIEQLGQGAMNIGTSIGQQVSTAGTNQGQFITGGQQNASPYQTAAQSYNPWASMLGGVGQSMNQYSNQNQWSY